jgi:hypothetical protein
MHGPSALEISYLKDLAIQPKHSFLKKFVL